MFNQQNGTNSSQPLSPEQQRQYEDLVRRVAERVWALWREDMRREREREGNARASGAHPW